MFEYQMPFVGLVDVPIGDFLADPLLLLKKFPDVKAITKGNGNEYIVETNPMAVTSKIHIPKKIVVSVSVVDGELILSAPADVSAYGYVDGWLEGKIVAKTETTSDVQGGITLLTPVPLVLRSAREQNAELMLTRRLMTMFQSNLKKEGFSNTLPA